MERTSLEGTVVLVNPAAGGGRAGRVWKALLEAEPRLGAVQTIVAGDAEAGITALDHHLGRASTTRVLALGGDGTAHLVADRLLRRAPEERPALGLVPAGTGSDLARSLGLPRRPLDALRRAFDCEPRRIDALRLTTDSGRVRHVVNVASAGVSGAVDEVVNAVSDRGRLTYLAATLSALRRYRPAACRVIVGGETIHDGPIFLAAVANGRTFGKGMRVAPKAELDDGLADIVVIPPVPAWQLAFRLPQFLAGRHLHLPFVTWRRGREVRLEPAAGLPPFDLDGETLPAEAAEVEVLAGALRILA